MDINHTLLSDALDRIAGLDKVAFVGAGDPAMGGAPAGGAPPMDPAMMGGAPPMDPAMMGGAPPMDPAMMMGGGAPPDIGAMLKPMIQEAIQEALQQAGGQGGQGGQGGGKMKVDIGAELQQIRSEMYQLKMLSAKLADAVGVQLSAAEMFSAPPGQQQGQPEHTHEPAAAPQDPAAMGGGLGRIEPIKAAEWEHGEAIEIAGSSYKPVTSFSSTADRARALLLRQGSR